MIRTRKATRKDVDSIVRIHLDAYKTFFLSSLGDKFLSLYYDTFIKSDRGVVFCAEKDDEMVGFAACSYVCRGFNSYLIMSNFFRYAAEALRLLFVQPKSIIRLAKNLSKESDEASIKDDGLYAEFFSLAVCPSCQREGVGRILVKSIEEDVKEHNNRISFTTDYYDNDKTLAFHHAMGYRDYYDFVTYPSRRMWRLIKEIKK